MKRKVILILIGISVLFSSCDNKNIKQPESSSAKKDITEKEEETITINVVEQFGDYIGEQEGWFADYLLKEKNITDNV